MASSTCSHDEIYLPEETKDHDPPEGPANGSNTEIPGTWHRISLHPKLTKGIEKKHHYTEAEFSWVADFNPRMRKIFVSVGGVPAKHYITYRYLFDRNKEFKRHPIPDIKG